MTDDLAAAIQRIGNLIAELAHPMGGCEANAIEDEAHDLLAELRVACERQAQEIARLRDLATTHRAALKQADHWMSIARAGGGGGGGGGEVGDGSHPGMGPRAGHPRRDIPRRPVRCTLP